VRAIATKKFVILTGDFNLTPENSNMHKIKQHLKDVDEKNLLQTWPMHDFTIADWSVPAGTKFKIDYIFTSPEMSHTKPSSIQSEASDHLPIVVDIEV